MSKLTFILLLSLPVTGVVGFVDRYIYSDWGFARAICTMVVIDTILSIVKHLIHKDASSESFWKGFSKKIFIYMMMMVVADKLFTYTVHNEQIGATEWIGTYICVAMMLREVISIIENSNAIMPWLPKGVLRRLRDFNDKGEYINNK